MRKALGAVALLFLAGLIAEVASAAELRVTGFFHNILRFDSNLSDDDNDMTRNDDQLFWGRSRSRFFFNFIASDDLRGVFALELDNTFGAPRLNPHGGRCIEATPTTNPYRFEQCGFRNAIDINNFELKNLFVEFRVPQIPVGNRFTLGGPPIELTPLHGRFLYAMDAGGGQATFTLTDQVSVLLTYVQLEEDLDRFVGSTKIGEDYITGATLMLRPIDRLDLHLIGAYYHGQNPFGPALTGGGGPFNAIRSDSVNVRTESRYYMGVDARYRLGNLSIDPTFVYLLGTRKFAGGAKVDFNAFETRLLLQYTMGNWRFAAQGTYATGNDANDDINNRRTPGTRPDDVGYRPLGIDGTHIFYTRWEILGGSPFASAGQSIAPVSPGENGRFDRFGVISGGGWVEYRATDRLLVEGSVNTMFTANRPGCPAVLQTSPTVCNDQEVNFSGVSKYIGTEVGAGYQYTIMPGLRLVQRFAWAFLGDAWGIREGGDNRPARDAYALGTQIRYDF